MEHKTSSLADHVFEHLETDILTGKYQRGEILTETKLSEELGVSRTPIREALRRLAQEHLIEESGKGSVVVGMTLDDVSDIQSIRHLLEGECAARTAGHITDEQLKELRDALELQEFYLSKKDPDHIKAMDNRFHELLYKFSGSASFYDTLVFLHKKLQKFRRVSVQNTSRAVQSVEEHRAIFEAIEQRDVEKARMAAEIHVNHATAHMLRKDN